MSLASQAAVAINNAKFISEIKDLFKAVVQYSASAIDARSPHTAGHSERVSALAVSLAQAVNDQSRGPLKDVKFTSEELEEIRYAGWLHDIGKIGVKEIVLDKSTKLSKDNITSLSHKFYAFILVELVNLLKTKIENFVPEGKRENLETLENEYETKRERLLDDLKFLIRINVPTERMNDSDISRLNRIKELTYTDPLGNSRLHLVDDDEYSNLSIRRGSLNEEERKEAQSHVNKSIKIIEKIPFRDYMKGIPDIVANHHEYLDGSGYPRGKKADSISIQSRILCIVDIFDALAAKDRPYKPAMPVDKACEILKKDADSGKLDKDLVELFIDGKVYASLYD